MRSYKAAIKLEKKCTSDLLNVKHLVFAGGGIRGLAVVGSLKSIFDQTGIDFSLIAHRPKSCTGVSIGALISLLIVIGFSVHDLIEFSKTLLNESFVTINPMHLLKGGLSVDNGEKLKILLEKQLRSRGFPASITLLQLFESTKVNLETVVTDLTTASIVYLSHETFPDLLVSTAVLSSMSLPLIFPPVKASNGHLWADGGILENFPIRKYPSEFVLGFSFLWKIDGKPDSLLSFIMRLIQLQNIPSEIASWHLLKPDYKKRTILIDCGSISMLGPNWDFALTLEIREALLHIGKHAAETTLENWGRKCIELNVDPGSRLPSLIPRILPSFLPPQDL